MRPWHTIRRALSAAWFAEVAWPLRLVRGVLAFYVVFALIAAVAWIGFGRDAEKAVVDLGEGFTAIVLIISLPLLLVGLIAVPVHRWLVRKLVDHISALDRDHPKA